MDTSKLRHDQIVKAGTDRTQRDTIYEALAASPKPLCSYEISAICGISMQSITPRIAELKRLGLVEATGYKESPEGAMVRSYSAISKSAAVPQPKKPTFCELCEALEQADWEINQLRREVREQNRKIYMLTTKLDIMRQKYEA